MKLFFKYIIISLVTSIIGLVVLDAVYTYVYSVNTRNKFQFIRSYKNKKADYIFLGSSRVENGLNPKVIDAITQKTSVNFGVQASGIVDLELLLKLIKDYNIKHERIFIQMDYIYNMVNKKSNVLDYQMAPFLNKNQNINSYFNSEPDGFVMQNIPFERFALTDQKNGIREFITSCIKKESNVVLNKGFSSLQGSTRHVTHSFPKEIVKENPQFLALLKTIKNEKLKVTFFCSPVRKDTENYDYIKKLKSRIPQLIDFSGAIKSEDLFKDNIHLNEQGANKFSEIFAKTILFQLTEK